MEPRELLEMLHVAERLKDTIRHSTTSKGRPESVAEHSWRLSLMAYLLKPVFPELDMDKAVDMCLIHDLGECFTGDIPTFDKTEQDRVTEEELLDAWVRTLPAQTAEGMSALYAEMSGLATPEAKLAKARDQMEAVIQHNEAPIGTWEDHEYALNRKYGFESAAFSPWLTALREEVLADTLKKIEEEGDSFGGKE